MPVLTAIDVLGVQSFVFSSNRLRDVVAGSWLVHWSTYNRGALEGFVSEENVLLAGGGNAVIEFQSLEEARHFTACYTRCLYEKAPGMEVAIAHCPFESGGLAHALQALQIKLARIKTERIPSSPLLGLSVTAACRETGLPATGFDSSKPVVPLSKEVLKRREEIANAGARWAAFLDQHPGFVFPLEFDLLGRSYGDTSLIGVVHVDGNSVGRKIAAWLSKMAESGAADEDVHREYREWSQAIDELGREAFQAVVNRVCGAVRKTVKEGQEAMEITGKPADLGFDLDQDKDKGEWMLPLRPILLGGDDLTFVCDGRIALDLAETALSCFEKSEVPHLGNISACAGVAIVRSHMPFARTYQLAGNLCSSAKRMLKEQNDRGCALDWHIGTSRPGETPESIRERQYRVTDYQLTCRPYRLGSHKDEAETWRWLSGTLLDNPEFGLRGQQWSKRRSKARALMEIVREGPDGVKTALKSWRVAVKKLQLPPGIQEDGFLAKSRTPLLDAVELLDLHLILEPTLSN